MDRRPAPLRTILRKIENSAERSPLFDWMCQHHDDLQKAARGRRLQWVSLCADFATDGLTSADGKAITPLIASRTWAKVRLEVGRRRALKKPRAEPVRVRAPVDSRPPTVNAGTSIAPRPQPTAVAKAQPIPPTGSLLERPKSEAPRIAQVALTKNPRERTPDEAAILDSRVTGEVLAEARRAGAKVILSGDDRQLASIERGGLFTELRKAHGAAEITEVTRQKVDWQRGAARDLAEGRFDSAVAAYDRHGAITWTEDGEAARAALVARWKADALADPQASRFMFA